MRPHLCTSPPPALVTSSHPAVDCRKRKVSRRLGFNPVTYECPPRVRRKPTTSNFSPQENGQEEPQINPFSLRTRGWIYLSCTAMTIRFGWWLLSKNSMHRCTLSWVSSTPGQDKEIKLMMGNRLSSMDMGELDPGRP